MLFMPRLEAFEKTGRKKVQNKIRNFIVENPPVKFHNTRLVFLPGNNDQYFHTFLDFAFETGKPLQTYVSFSFKSPTKTRLLIKSEFVAPIGH